MKCPKCQAVDTKVLDSRVVEQDTAIRRRRECESCSFRFTTYEKPELAPFLVIKKDGTREPYTRAKVEDGIWRACTKRPVSVEQVNDMLTALEQQWYLQKEVSSQEIGKDIMQALRKLDEVAYIRFASVYRSFKDVEEFKDELETLLRG